MSHITGKVYTTEANIRRLLSELEQAKEENRRMREALEKIAREQEKYTSIGAKDALAALEKQEGVSRG